MKPVLSRLSLLVSLFLIINSTQAAKPLGKGKPNNGEDTESGLQQCEYPSFADSPKDKLRGDAANFYIQYGNVIAQMEMGDLIFNETGNVTHALKSDSALDGRWFVEDMSDVQHRVGNDGIELVESNEGMSAEGNSCGLPCSPEGKRWSGWYNYSEGSLATWTDSSLTLGGKRAAEVDLTRPGSVKWYNNKLYTTWLSTLQRDVDTENGDPIFGSRKRGSQTFRPNMYFKSRVSFEQMQTPGFRLSMWLMPVEQSGDEGASPSIAYDGNPKNGFEMDIFEFEPVAVLRDQENKVEKVCGNSIEFSWINAFYDGRGKAPSGIDGKNNFEGAEEGYCTSLDCSDAFANPIPVSVGGGLLRPDINEGFHLIEFLWTDSAIVWAFNGEIVLEIDDVNQMPDIDREHYLIVSREMTNGLTSGAQQYDGGEFFLPPEPGLYGWNGNSNIGDHFDLIDDDKALIDFIEIYHVEPQ